MKKRLLLNAIMVSIMSLSLNSVASATTTTSSESSPIDLTYKSSYTQAGCSENAWKTLTAQYEVEQKKYNAIAEPLNKKMYESGVVDPFKSLSDCVSSMKSQFNGLIDVGQKVVKLASSFSNGGFASLAGSLLTDVFNNVSQEVVQAACNAANNAVSQGLNKLNVNSVVGELNSFTSNPFSYGLNKSGIASSLNNVVTSSSINSDIAGIVNGAVKTGTTTLINGADKAVTGK